MSDWPGYAIPLAGKTAYQNTYLDRDPALDIMEEPTIHGLDFVISSDVFEHVGRPVEKAFTHVFSMLAPGGVFVLTVPYGLQPSTIEHFPPLTGTRVGKDRKGWYLSGMDSDGRSLTFRGLVFHGGDGVTVEMRVFAKSHVRTLLTEAGFEDVVFHEDDDLALGIRWPHPWGVTVTARRPQTGS